MTEYDSNLIKPVESLQNITRLDPAKRRDGRKPRQQMYEQNKEENESTEEQSGEVFDESAGQENVLKKDAKHHDIEQDSDTDGIDFCA
jgi:hypothetical protein